MPIIISLNCRSDEFISLYTALYTRILMERMRMRERSKLPFLIGTRYCICILMNRQCPPLWVIAGRGHDLCALHQFEARGRWLVIVQRTRRKKIQNHYQKWRNTWKFTWLGTSDLTKLFSSKNVVFIASSTYFHNDQPINFEMSLWKLLTIRTFTQDFGKFCSIHGQTNTAWNVVLKFLSFLIFFSILGKCPINLISQQYIEKSKLVA